MYGKMAERFIIFVICFVSTFSATTFGLENTTETTIHVPITGPKRPKVKLLDKVMLEYREKIGCTAATLAISKEGQILYRRGYGWQDREKTIPTDPDTMIGMASCDKPIISASIKRLARQKHISLDISLFEVLTIKPQGTIVDPRVNNITLNHILEHKAGWGADPYSPAIKAARKAGVEGPLSIEVLLSFIMTMPLEDEPGTVSKYCNFGFDTLRHIVEKWSGKSFVEYACTTLLGLPSTRGMHIAGLPREDNVPPLVWNGRSGGIDVSARVLCRFMERYWLTGEPRRGGNPYWVMYGSLNGSTAMTVWRPDGINLVALFNGRSADVGHDEIKNELEKVIDLFNVSEN